MSRLLQFFSVAVLTQIVLMLSQVVLLPIQVRLWGHAATATWYSAIAVAMLTSVVDCGLRTAGHAELLEHVSERKENSFAADSFRQVWAWIRLLVLGITLLLVAGSAVASAALQSSPYPLWKAALAFAYACETILIIRIGYLDSLGYYRGAETSYLFFAALRLGLCLPALLVFRLEANGLAWLFLGTSVIAVAVQGNTLCRKIPALALTGPLPHRLSVRALAVVRHTVAEPGTNWVRLSLPVLVIAAIASPAMVTTYVALRAAFGAARATIQQLARVASVEYLRLHSAGRELRARTALALSVIGASLFGSAVASLIVADNLRILGIWLKSFDRASFQLLCLPFALAAPFFAYQIIYALLFRTGELAFAARRHWAYIVYSSTAAVIAIKVFSIPLYILLLVLSEIAIAATFLLSSQKTRRAEADAGRRGFYAACFGSVLVALLWWAVRSDTGNIFTGVAPGTLILTASILAVFLAVLFAFAYYTNLDLLKSSQSPSAVEPDSSIGGQCYSAQIVDTQRIR